MADEAMVTTTCPTLTCGVPFSIPRHIWEQIRSRGTDRKIFCPNGHVMSWSETNEERLTKKVAQLETQVEGLTSIKYKQEEEIDGLHRTISYWQGMATRWKRKAGHRG